MDYRSAGVDIDAASRAKEKVRALARTTFTPGVLSDIGGFGGLFRFEAERFREPVLVASTDGVGTKLKVAFAARRHDTVGYDLVCHCINDILVQGARPLFFLDYLAMGKLLPEVAEAVISGIARACREFQVALLGGETAEMPGFYPSGEYDLAGTIVGAVERGAVVDGRSLEPGDALLGLPSAGLHTNGYSLARRILFDREGLTVDSRIEELGGTVSELLLAPHRCYLRPVKPLLEAGLVKAMAHVTGGGITDNVPRVLPKGTAARIRLGSWPVPRLFGFLREKGGVSQVEMLRSFNLGIGLVVMVSAEQLEAALDLLWQEGEEAVVIGEIVAGKKEVLYEGAL
ncbi:MAG: phosphoribosylformylglycinamidine cyclo-ligase [Acidobacteriota bacterium]